MKIVFRAIPWLILLIPFAVLAFFYNSISNEILIVRSFFGNEETIAPKTLFTVFRVPLIEVVCAFVIEIMRRKFALVSADYERMWNILLYTVSLKSLFQGFEIISSKDSANLFYYLTFGIVIIGIIAALFVGRRFFTNFSRDDWKFSQTEKAILIILLIAYLGLAIVPIFVFG